jgi:hypothetical protein
MDAALVDGDGPPLKAMAAYFTGLEAEVETFLLARAER